MLSTYELEILSEVNSCNNILKEHNKTKNITTAVSCLNSVLTFLVYDGKRIIYKTTTNVTLEDVVAVARCQLLAFTNGLIQGANLAESLR